MRVLALGAHYDDIEIGIGGTLAKHISNGDTITFAITESNTGRSGNSDLRLEEQSNALDLLGVSKDSLLLFKSFDEDPKVIGELDSLHPDLVYTMCDTDTHFSHRRCSLIGQSVARKPNISLIFYGGTRITFYTFVPNLFSLIDFEFKLRLLSCFKSQIEKNSINLELLKRYDSYLGMSITGDSNTYAEGLLIKKGFWL